MQPPTRTIDHILAPKGFMEIQQAFIFNSLILPEKTLAQYGVKREALSPVSCLRCRPHRPALDDLDLGERLPPVVLAFGHLVDPMFVDPANGDFRFRPNSPALKMGIVPIDVSKAGLRDAA